MEKQDSVQRFLELIRRSHRGKFKVYIGMSAGVGKTCRMLQEARQLLDAGVDVRIGYIETHGRAGTEALVEGLPFVPRRKLFYKGKELEEMDLTLAYALGPVTLSVADLYWTGHADDRYFVFDSRSPHRIEVGASWVVSEKVPVTLSWYTVLFGAADVNHKGERAYASYFEAACPFTVKTVDMKAGVGMVPWNAVGTYGIDRDFYVQNVFLNAGKSWNIKGTESMSIGIFTNLVWNPAMEDVNFVGGFSFRM